MGINAEGSSRYYNEFEILRFLAAVCIAYGHLDKWALFSGGPLAVDFFFILSGVVLAKSIDSSNIPYKTFILKRFMRLYPLHIFATIFLVFVWLNTGKQDIPQEIDKWLLTLTMTSNWGFIDELFHNKVAWSISAEFLIALILLIPLTKVNNNYYNVILIVLCLIALLTLGTRIDYLHKHQIGFTSAGVIRCAMGAAIGIMIYRCSNKYKDIFSKLGCNHGIKIQLILCFLVMVAFFYSDTLITSVLAIAVISLFLCSLLLFNTVINRFLTFSCFVWLGRLSYPIYLLHFPILVGFKREEYDLLDSSQLFMMIVLGAAVVAYYLIEKPNLYVLKKMFAVRKPL